MGARKMWERLWVSTALWALALPQVEMYLELRCLPGLIVAGPGCWLREKACGREMAVTIRV